MIFFFIKDTMDDDNYNNTNMVLISTLLQLMTSLRNLVF